MDLKMKVLMYGWEFPPRISGGLGVACYAIVKELAKQNVGVTLVLPYTVADSIKDSHVQIVGCDHAVKLKEESRSKELENVIDIKYAPLVSYLNPYVSSRDLQQLFTSATLKSLLEILAKIALPEEIKQLAIAAAHPHLEGAAISGTYGANLLLEVFRYATVAGEIAKTAEHDVIHAHDWLTVLAAIEAKRVSKKPLVFHVHALETDRSGIWIDKRIFAIEKYGMEQADKVITVSEYTKSIAVQYYGIAPEKISVVHNGIYYDEQVPVELQKKAHPQMILFLGRVTHQKGPAYFIDVAKKILNVRPDVQFVVAGVGDLLISMIEKVAALRIGKNVHFLGFLDQEKVKKIFQLTDVYVMTSVSEPFGLSPLEALSNRVPTVISKQSGVAEVLNHILATDFWDTDDMAAKVLALLEYRALREASITNSMQDLKKLTWDSTASKIIEVYNGVKS